ncbi:nuclear mRNA export, poly(A)+RNA binding protein [Ascosphaera aggregata]|nr:nuclear mRNA export, poly(A)+RNA binding protein [Ascosphaera aggregata]
MMRGKRDSNPKPTSHSRGGIRKRNAVSHADRDGDLDMDSRGSSGRIAKRGRDTPRGRGGPVRKAGSDGDNQRKLEALQKALSAGSTQANVRSRRDQPSPSLGRGRSSAEVTMSVRGWRDAQGALDPDGGVGRLIGWIERKATPKHGSGRPVKILKSHKEGDALIISVRADQANLVNRINGFDFLDSRISINIISGTPTSTSRESHRPSHTTEEIKEKITAFLAKRYNPQTKVLDLSRLSTDPDMVAMGMFNHMPWETKHFSVLMVVCESNYKSFEKRKEAIQSVSLASNDLRNVSRVTTLSQTFPELHNLDLSNNDINEFSDMIAWRWKFRDLEFLDLSNNPISTKPEIKETMMKWYPKMRTLNNVMVRTAEEVALLKRTPIPVVGPNFVDENQIAENFVKGFFVGYDNDRENVVRGIYDAHSTFSLNINTAAPRAVQGESTAGWDAYIRKSRNLSRCTQLPARMARMYTGTDSILEAWKSLPPTRHPDIMVSPQDWLIECHPMPALPDYTNNLLSGVGGLIITVHGKFDEVDPQTGHITHARSFDRVFILGPGGGVGGLRVNNDMLTLRAYGGNEAWIPESGPVPNGVSNAASAHPEAQQGYGMPLPGKSELQCKEEQAILQVSFQTKMTLEYSQMALAGNNWDIEAALKNFEILKAQGSLPPSAFLPGA